MMKDNPFLDNKEDEEDEEEKVYIPKPYQKETLTQKQRDSNIKGIRKCIEDLKKITPGGRYYDFTKRTY